MDKNRPISVINTWEDFLKAFPGFQNNEPPEYWHFCDNQKDADECAELVTKGIKRTTSPSL